MGDNDEIVGLLRRHYDENVMPLSAKLAAPEFEALKDRMENPKTFEEAVAEKLNKYHWKREEIKKSDLESSKLAKLDPRLSLAVIKVPEEKIPVLFKKLHFPKNVASAAISGNGCGLNVILLPDDKNSGIKHKHEEAHILRNETCRPYNEMMRFLRENNERDGAWFKAMNLKEELGILDELLAYGAQWYGAGDEELFSYFWEAAQRKAETMGDSGLLPDCGIIGRHRAQKIVAEKIADYMSKRIRDKEIMMAGSRFYAAEFAQAVGDMHLGPENSALPDGGVVSRHKAKAVLENATYEYFKRQFDEGNGAFKLLYKNLPFETVSKIVRSCESVNELVLWSKHYKEALASR